MKLRTLLFVSLVAASSLAEAVETVVILRHGEKPEAGLGQLSCQGLNRALALPDVLLGRFGMPQAIFASNPGKQKKDRGVPYSYVRPLITIAPTAIRAGLPIDTRFGFDELDLLEEALLAPRLRNATLFVAWEHHLGESLARKLMADFGGDPAGIPEWQGEDFDSLYVVSLSEDAGGRRHAGFRRETQGLDGRAASCPSP